MTFWQAIAYNGLRVCEGLKNVVLSGRKQQLPFANTVIADSAQAFVKWRGTQTDSENRWSKQRSCGHRKAKRIFAIEKALAMLGIRKYKSSN